MGNVESTAPVGPSPSSPSNDEKNHWHGTHPDKEPSGRHPPKVPASLQRKGSSFLEEPVTHKLTERGEATVTVTVAATNHRTSSASSSSLAAASEGRQGADEGGEIDTFPPDSRFASENRLRYAVSEMQGWRSHMEDKHALNPVLSSNSQQKRLLRDHHLFAVFDGHGGDFASHFCGEHFVSTLTAQKDWQKYLKLSASSGGGGDRGDAGADASSSTQDSVAGLALLKSALTSAFLALDAKLLTAQRGRRVSQLSQLEDLVYSMGGTVEHDVFHKGTKDHERVMGFDRLPPASMPVHVPFERSGSTGVVVLVTPSHILCANAGDSRAILSKRTNSVILSKDGVLPLSFDHKPSNDIEVTRVERGGGFVRNGRVDGDLAVSRSFGDFGYKRCRPKKAKGGPKTKTQHNNQSVGNGNDDDHVAVCPDILVHTREPAKDEFLVLACDGIWDRLSNRDCADLVRKLIREEDETDVGLMCEEVIDTALELDSRDNMTVCLVVFPGANTGGGGNGNGPQQQGVVSSKKQRDNNRGGGVMRRRSVREQQWGGDSTPAKRALLRLEERKKKNREIIALQKSKALPKSQARRMGREGGSSAALQLSPSGDSVATGRSGTSTRGGGAQQPSSSSSNSHANRADGKKHRAAQSPPRERVTNRARSGKGLRLQVGGTGATSRQ